MHIPRAWAKASGEGQTPDHRTLPVAVWGWGDDEAGARREAANRLQRLLDRIRGGEPFPDKYPYGSRPLREEILQTFEDDGSRLPSALLTRNTYGATVLNTARLLFLDIDVPAPTFVRRLRRMFGGGRATPDGEALPGLRDVLHRFGGATFRLYRTAAGLRAMAVDREFDPGGTDTQELMRATGTDPAFSRLCLAQRSFRARLTPKPWRCHCPPPPSEHPRVDDEVRRRFAAWLREYEKASTGYATCQYLETVGTGSPRSAAGRLVELHDRLTRCHDALPLA